MEAKRVMQGASAGTAAHAPLTSSLRQQETQTNKSRTAAQCVEESIIKAYPALVQSASQLVETKFGAAFDQPALKTQPALPIQSQLIEGHSQAGYNRNSNEVVCTPETLSRFAGNHDSQQRAQLIIAHEIGHSIDHQIGISSSIDKFPHWRVLSELWASAAGAYIYRAAHKMPLTGRGLAATLLSMDSNAGTQESLAAIRTQLASLQMEGNLCYQRGSISSSYSKIENEFKLSTTTFAVYIAPIIEAARLAANHPDAYPLLDAIIHAPGPMIKAACSFYDTFAYPKFRKFMVDAANDMPADINAKYCGYARAYPAHLVRSGYLAKLSSTLQARDKLIEQLRDDF